MSRDRPEATTSPSPSVGEAPDPRRWRALAVCLVAGFMTLLDVSIVNVALPSIREAVGASSSELQWVVSGYALTFGLVLVPAGRLGDMRGRRTMFIVGVAVFTLSSLLAGLAPTALLLVVARLVQGIGGGLLNPQVVRPDPGALPRRRAGPGLRHARHGDRHLHRDRADPRRPHHRRARRRGRMALDLLRQHPDRHRRHRPVAAAAAGAAPAPGARGHDLDLVGVGLLGAGVLAILFPLVQEQQWHGNDKWALLAVGVVLMGVFVAWERRYAARRHEPLVDVSLFGLPGYAPGATLALTYFAGFTGIFFVLTLFFQTGLGYSALLAGLAVTPFAAGSAVTAAVGGRYVTRAGRPMVVLGLLLVVVGLVLTDLVLALHGDEHAAGWWTAAPLLLAGVGSGLVISPNQTLTLAHVPVQRAGSAGGVIQTGQRLGTAAGIALVGSVYFGTLSASHGDDAQAAGHGLRVAVALTAVALASASWTSCGPAPPTGRDLPRPPLHREGQHPREPQAGQVQRQLQQRPADLCRRPQRQPERQVAERRHRRHGDEHPHQGRGLARRQRDDAGDPGQDGDDEGPVVGCQMKPVSGRARVTASGVTHPPARASRASTATTSTAVANDAASSPIARRVISSRPRTTPVAAAAIAANSGPTTIAPTTSTEESVMTAIDASATATIVNA